MSNDVHSSIAELPVWQLQWLFMWTVMMTAMMLPSFVPSLIAYRRAIVSATQRRADVASLLLSAGYFVVWVGVGVGLLALDAAYSAFDTWRPVAGGIVPIGTALAVLFAGALQLSGWKARQLRHCIGGERVPLSPTAAEAFRRGSTLGRCCVASCAPIMSLLLVTGIMDLRGMMGVTVAITIECVAPFGMRFVRPFGVALTVAGLTLVSRV